MNSYKKAVVMYIPAIHAGYINFLKEHLDKNNTLYLINGNQFGKNHQEIEYLQRDLRAIPVSFVIDFIIPFSQNFGAFGNNAGKREVFVLNSLENFKLVIDNFDMIIMPDDDVSQFLLSNIQDLDRNRIYLEKSFLRWDKNTSLLESEINVPTITLDGFGHEILSQLKNQIEKSSDWWRQVACVVFDNNHQIILSAYNKHYPNDMALNVFGDPRFNFKPGEHIENCSAIHAEAWVIAQAAREGIPLKNMNMLVSDFPCPICAKSIAETEIKNLYFLKGYSKSDGQKILEDKGVILRKVLA